jgi:hypothetical protein
MGKFLMLRMLRKFIFLRVENCNDLVDHGALCRRV